MMTFIGRLASRGAGLLALMLVATTAIAKVTATLDRDNVAMGDTMRLSITATRDSEDLGDTDLRPLMADFEILQRSTRSSTSIINGERKHQKELLLEITPKREGQLNIPPMRVGAGASNALQVNVMPAPDANSDGATVLFDAELDRQQVYVQGQVILTLRLQQAINLDNRSISELSLDQAFVKPLEQKSFQRTVDGRAWLVHEVRYAIFPEHSGRLEIPAQTFSAREVLGRRSLFDRGNGRVVRMRTDPLIIDVMPRPADYPATTWLPARSLELEESWSATPDTLQAGASITRTISLRAEGLQGAQLPPVLFAAQDGVKFYPDQPAIEEREVASGLEGRRVDSTALVPTRAGELLLPEIRIPWWDVESGQLRHAILPERRIPVTAAAPDLVAPAPSQSIQVQPGQLATASDAPAGNTFPWHWLTGLTTVGWLLTLLWALRRSPGPSPAPSDRQERPAEKRAYKQLLAACASDSAAQARQALLDWTAALDGAAPAGTEAVAGYFADAGMAREIDELNRALYAEGSAPWQGQALATLVKRLRKDVLQGGNEQQPLQLYPSTT